MAAYDLDVHAWARNQADALRRRSANELDWENIAEEIDGLGAQQQWELYNRLVVLLTHLLKWVEQPERRSRSWSHTIRVQRKDLGRLLRQSPSLAAVQDEEFAEAYATARLAAAAETGFAEERFPKEPPFTVGQALESDWMPDTDGSPPRE